MVPPSPLAIKTVFTRAARERTHFSQICEDVQGIFICTLYKASLLTEVCLEFVRTRVMMRPRKDEVAASSPLRTKRWDLRMYVHLLRLLAYLPFLSFMSVLGSINRGGGEEGERREERGEMERKGGGST